ncbi:MAG: hypothetical protein WDW36_006854 [Sanguina aurantia]
MPPLMPEGTEDEMIEDGQEIQITPDGGLIKRIITKGRGWEKPEKGDKVSVHYVGTLEDGTKFDSSRDRDDLFVFELGEGRVIKGWDLGVATMKMGEKAVLICQSDYAYGAQGSPPKIPANATLHFEVELFSWESIKDLAGDGGIIKTVLSEGQDWETPKDRDEVRVHLSAKAQGASQPFLVSPEEGLEFTVSEGLLGSKGLGLVVKTMKKGARAHLVLQPAYGFSSALLGGAPSEGPCEVEVTLASWKKVEDVTPDGGVLKKVLTETADEYKKPNEGASVTIRYHASLSDGTVVESRLEGDEFTFVTESGEVPEGLDQAVMSMKKGEVATFEVTAAYGYAAAGRAATAAGAAVPPDAALKYAITLVDFTNAPETWEMKDHEKVAAAVIKKDKGNVAFKAGNLKKAMRDWDQAAKIVDYDKDFADEHKAGSKDVKKSCWLNTAAAKLKQGDWKEAEKSCTKVLGLEPGNVKALYRRAQAQMGLQDFLAAEMDLRKGLSEDATNVDLLTLSKRLKVMSKEMNKKESKMYGKMFAPSAKSAEPMVTEAVAAPPAASTEHDSAPAAPES